jgi:hypothetical protein
VLSHLVLVVAEGRFVYQQRRTSAGARKLRTRSGVTRVHDTPTIAVVDDCRYSAAAVRDVDSTETSKAQLLTHVLGVQSCP